MTFGMRYAHRAHRIFHSNRLCIFNVTFWCVAAEKLYTVYHLIWFGCFPSVFLLLFYFITDETYVFLAFFSYKNLQYPYFQANKHWKKIESSLSIINHLIILNKIVGNCAFVFCEFVHRFTDAYYFFYLFLHIDNLLIVSWIVKYNGKSNSMFCLTVQRNTKNR